VFALGLFGVLIAHASVGAQIVGLETLLLVVLDLLVELLDFNDLIDLVVLGLVVA
jgi:hypothetical protein